MAANYTHAMRHVKHFARRLAAQFADDHVTDLAAMLTYYAIMALFPLALFALSVAALILPGALVEQGIAMAMRAVPSQIGPMISEHVHRLQAATGGHFAIIGAALALWGGSRGLDALRIALNRAYGIEETRPWWKRQVIAVGVTLLAVIASILATSLLLVGPWVRHLIADRFGAGGVFDLVWSIGRWIGAAVVVMLLWGMLYKLLPDVKRPFKWLTPGAVTGVVIWLGASALFSAYVSRFGKFEPTYGTLAGVIIFLYWLWISNIVLILGGEINEMREERKAQVKRRDESLVPRTSSGPLAPRESWNGNGLGELARRMGDDVSTLVKDHVELAKLELAADVKKAGVDVGATVIGVLVAVIGFAMLCSSAVVALAPVMHPLWLRMLIMSIVYLVVGGGIAGAFVRKLKGDATLEAPKSVLEARRTVNVLKEQMHHG